MTFEQTVLLYLYQHKKLSLNLFGTIELEVQIPDSDIIRKEKAMPVEGLTFTFDPNVKTDQEFIHFYASEKGKIIPLADSDIELQLIQAKQIVNIGNPFDLPGIGKIVKKDDGNLTILPGYYSIPPVSGSGRPVQLRERATAAVLPKGERETEKKKELSQKQKQWIVLSGIGILVVAAAWAIFTFAWPLLQKPANNAETISVIEADTAKPAPVVTPPIDTTPVVAVIDSLTEREWKAIISETKSKFVADERLKKYVGYGHNAFLDSLDSTRYSIYIRLSAAGIDTARKRDSLTRFFGFPVKLEPLQ